MLRKISVAENLVSAMRRAKIVDVKQSSFGATTKNTSIRQRDKLEETMVNLANFLGRKGG
jgi:hypothetical protein